MRQLELQQEREERELLERAQTSTGVAVGESTAVIGSPGGAPVRSRSGNDLVSFQSSPSPTSNNVIGSKALEYSNAKSMPGSRRHSGEIAGEDGAGGNVVVGSRRRNGNGEPMLNSFLFDDELEADLQSGSLSCLCLFISRF